MKQSRFHDGVPFPKCQDYGQGKRERLDNIAAQMRARYLSEGIGCKARAKVIAERTGGPPEPPHLPRD